jgi:hypothetical protein
MRVCTYIQSQLFSLYSVYVCVGKLWALVRFSLRKEHISAILIVTEDQTQVPIIINIIF